jgi:hypothetical protein
MEFNNKKLEKTSKLINYVIAIVLCGFLISLSSKFLDDIDQWKERPMVEEFTDLSLRNENNSEIAALEEKINLKREKISNLEKTVQIANSNYSKAKESYDNWLKARKTVGSPNEDKEVISRANQLDEIYKTQQEWELEIARVNEDIQDLYNQQQEFYEVIQQDEQRAYEEQEKAYRKYNLKIFLIRLAVILPLLLLGIFFIVKFRKHKYWPLFLGYILFSFYAFFFGLVPYLPSYGGYIRYTVGIILSIVFGIYAINKIRAFMERKKSELKESTQDRAKKVQTETAEKALDNHMCPSCGKDFIVKGWDKSVGKKTRTEALGMVTNFCRFCGLELFKPCKKCGHENYAHLPFCANCGDVVNEEKAEFKPD